MDMCDRWYVDIYSCIYIHIIVCYVNKDPTHLQGLDLVSDITSAVDYHVPSENGVESVDFSFCFGKLQKNGAFGTVDIWTFDVWFKIIDSWLTLKSWTYSIWSILNSYSIGVSITEKFCAEAVLPFVPIRHWLGIVCHQKMPLETAKPWLWSRAKSTMFELSAQCIWGLYPVSWKSHLRAFRFLILKH